MHNGSVPNLYEMLKPAAERTKKFYLGGDFDPVKVGLDTSCDLRDFPNGHHAVGELERWSLLPEWSARRRHYWPVADDEQRWALVEYLKSIPEEPGRITPFGGFPEGQLPQP